MVADVGLYKKAVKKAAKKPHDAVVRFDTSFLPATARLSCIGSYYIRLTPVA